MAVNGPIAGPAIVEKDIKSLIADLTGVIAE